MLGNRESKPTFTKGLNSECKRFKITIKEKAFADLVSMGWKDKDAYMITGMYNPVYSPDVNFREMNKLLMEDDDFIAYFNSKERQVRKRKKANEDINSGDISEEDIASELSKDNQLRELIAAKRKYDEGSKEWLDIKKMIADITQVKKDQIEDEESTVHFYLPLSCYSCHLYMDAKGKNQKQITK